MKTLNFFKLSILSILIFAVSLKTLKAMHESDYESNSSDSKEKTSYNALAEESKEIAQNQQSQKLNFELLPCEIKLLFLQHLILKSKDFDSAVNNIINFAKNIS